MGVGFRRLAMRRPARMADADRPAKRRRGKFRLKVLELALGSPPLQLAVLERRHAGGIVAAYSSRFSASTIEPATGPVPRIPTIPHIRKSLPEIDPATASLRATTGSITSHVRRGM